MKAGDLMIGDWYAFRGHPYKCTASDIASIAECEEKGAPTDISEIPITPEILEKNGWDDWCEHSKIARSISVLIEENTNLCIQEVKGQDAMFVQIHHSGAGTFEFRKHIKYVHELQHALRLCGIDKTIEL